MSYDQKLITEAEEFVKYGADLNPQEAERLIGELCAALSRAAAPDGSAEHHKTAAALGHAVSRADRAEAAIERVRAAHRRISVLMVASDKSRHPRDTCAECSRMEEGQLVSPGDAYVWPCPTVQALGDAPGPEWEYGVQATVNLDGTPNARIEPASEKELPHLRESQRRGWCTIYHRRKAGPWEVVADAE